MAVILDEFPHMAGTASSLAGTFALVLAPRRRVAVAGYLYQCVADDLVDCACAACPFCFISTPAVPKTVTGAVSLNGAEECAGGVEAYRTMAKRSDFIVDVYQLPIHHFSLLYVYFM